MHEAGFAVLLIEDNPGDARLLALMLAETTGPAVRLTRVDRLSAGLAELSASPQAFDAVLLDLTLPDSQGLATSLTVQQAAPDVPVVVLSGLADEELAMQAVSQGAQDYLVKGQVDGQTILRSVRYAIERQRAETERRHLLAREQQARTEAERLAAERAAILSQIAEGVVIASPTNQITFMNAAAQRLLGRATGPLAQGWADTLGTPLPSADYPLTRASLQGETTLNGEWEITRPDGSVVIARGNAGPVVTPEGRPLGAVLTLRDVTSRRLLEREREEFFANASHDLRTPLAAIKAAIGVVLANEPADMPAPLHRMLTNSDHAATEMSRLVDDLLELGRLQRGRTTLLLATIDLRLLVQRAAAAIEPLLAERGQQLALSLPAEPLLVFADGPRIERVLLNLLGNAQKYGYDGGRITVHAEQQPGEALVSVADDGPGIPPEDCARIFERYYRPRNGASQQIVGSGLGLPIAKALMMLHGGRVAVESSINVGSTFTIALPLATTDQFVSGPRERNLDEDSGR